MPRPTKRKAAHKQVTGKLAEYEFPEMHGRNYEQISLINFLKCKYIVKIDKSASR